MSDDNHREQQGFKVEPPWIVSQKGAVYCMWQNLPDNIREHLKQEHDFEMMLGEFSYRVKRNGDGSCIVFRNIPRDNNNKNASRRWQPSVKEPAYRTVEIQILPVEEANKLLASSNQFDVIGTDPVKVVNEQFFAIVGKKEKVL